MTNPTAQAVAGKIREVAARLAEQTDPTDGWDQALRRHAYKHLVAFKTTSGTVVVGTPVTVPSHLRSAAWPDIARQAATTSIDIATEELGTEGTIHSDDPHAVLFTIERGDA